LEKQASFVRKIRQNDGEFFQKPAGQPKGNLETSSSEKTVAVPAFGGVEFSQAVPQTDTGGLVEYTKAGGRKRFKELGKKAGRKVTRCPAWLTQLSTFSFQLPTFVRLVVGC